MAVVSVIYEANQLCHAFDNDPLLFKITIHSLVMCHKAKYQTRSKTFMYNKYVSDLQGKLSPILSLNHLFRIYNDFNLKMYYKGLDVKSGPSTCDLDYHNRGRLSYLPHFFMSSVQHIIRYYTMHM
jgi:hypothetical protein